MSLLMEPVIQYLHALAVAVLLGKVVLLSFVVAPILAKNLEREPFGKSFGSCSLPIISWAWRRLRRDCCVSPPLRWFVRFAHHFSWRRPSGWGSWRLSPTAGRR